MDKSPKNRGTGQLSEGAEPPRKQSQCVRIIEEAVLGPYLSFQRPEECHVLGSVAGFSTLHLNRILILFCRGKCSFFLSGATGGSGTVSLESVCLAHELSTLPLLPRLLIPCSLIPPFVDCTPQVRQIRF